LGAERPASLVPQQTGVLFIIKQQVQPASSMQLRQSQHAWIMAAHCPSPDVQVTVQPPSVISHLQMPIVRLQQHTVMPFIMQQHEHMPPASIVHRFCTMLTAILSSQVQVMRIPPWHFSMRKLQRGTIIQLVPAGIPVGVLTGEVPG
jgi:hypothetical protein